MQIDPELLALIIALAGALFALGWQYIQAKFSNVPDVYEIFKIAGAIVSAAKENHELKDNAARLSWALEHMQSYLDAKGIGKAFNARVLVEYALEKLKQNEAVFSTDFDE